MAWILLYPVQSDPEPLILKWYLNSVSASCGRVVFKYRPHSFFIMSLDAVLRCVPITVLRCWTMLSARRIGCLGVLDQNVAKNHALRC